MNADVIFKTTHPASSSLSLSLFLSLSLPPEPSIMVLAAQTVQMMIHAPSPLWKYHYQYFTIFHKINLHVHGTLKGQKHEKRVARVQILPMVRKPILTILQC